MILQKKFSKIFKISVSSGFNRSSLFFDRSKREKENSVFQLKVLGLLDSFPIPFDQSSLFPCTFQSLLDSSRPINFCFFLKTYRNHIRLFKLFLVYLSDPSLNPFSQKRNFVIFLVKVSKVFFKLLR